ncbi:MAG: hypothetical protein K0S39_4579 [Paenibacillus sp.]|nr:hypothetical protein [Paenibacillus sp.]
MKKMLLLLIMASCSLTGCWSKAELPERGFVMGVAVDQGKERKISLTSQIYKPTEAGVAKGGKHGESYINIHTTDDTLFEAVRDITIHLGRRAQWSHMRIIAIGEEVAKTTNLGDLLDYFYRDHEPRLTSPVLITQGSAQSYFDETPIIEETLSQQLLRAEKTSNTFAGKTIDTTLLTLGQQLKSQVPDAAVPYIYQGEKKTRTVFVAGVALIRNGKMVKVMPAKSTEALLFLLNKYNSGVIEMPCEDKKTGMNESIEVTAARSKLITDIKGDQVSVQAKINIDAAVGELVCSKVKTAEEEAEFVKRIKQSVIRELEATVKLLKKEKVDVLGIGNKVYSQHPKLWKKLKPRWAELYANVPFSYSVEVTIVTSGTTIGQPLSAGSEG